MNAIRPLLAALFLALATPAQSADLALDDSALRSRYDNAKGPGAYAIAAIDGKIVFARGYGEANIELHAPWSADSVVRIASLTKQFTAVAILKLIERRKLRLDAPLRETWPQCPRQWCEITIRQLLSHLSGITDDLAPLLAKIKEDLSVDQLLTLYADHPLLSRPGSQWRYSNVNYWILGKVIEIAGGEPYAEFVSHQILTPAMTHTRYGSHGAIIESRAAGYEIADDGHPRNARYFSTTLGYAAGGFLSSPRDMAIWYAALGRGEIISRASLALALTGTRTLDGKASGYGLGWYVGDSAGMHVAHHGGSTFGFESCVSWTPERAALAAVFKNSSDRDGEPCTTSEALLTQLLQH